MIKKTSIVVILILFLGIGMMNCAGPYEIIKENPPASPLSGYQDITVGYLGFPPSTYANFGYENEAEFTAMLDRLNEGAMPQFLNEFLPEKSISFTTSTQPTGNSGLFILFKDTRYEQNWNAFTNALDYLYVTVVFTDMSTGAEVYSAEIKASSSGNVYGAMALEGRMNNCFYYVANFIADKLTPTQ